MKRKEDYELLFLHAFKPGDVVRVEMKDNKEFNSQRMMIRRLLEKLTLEGHGG